MQKTFCFIFLISFLFLSCSPLNVDETPPRRDDDREGEVELPTDLEEELSFRDFLKNCKPDVQIPANTVDIFLDVFNLRSKYPPAVFRDCLQKKLEDGHAKICTARDQLERKRENARTDAEKARYENQLYRLEQIEFKFNQRLYNLAVKFDDQLIKLENDRSGNDLTRTFRFLQREKTEALRDILDTESYSECNFSYK